MAHMRWEGTGSQARISGNSERRLYQGESVTKPIRTTMIFCQFIWKLQVVSTKYKALCIYHLEYPIWYVASNNWSQTTRKRRKEQI